MEMEKCNFLPPLFFFFFWLLLIYPAHICIDMSRLIRSYIFDSFIHFHDVHKRGGSDRVFI